MKLSSEIIMQELDEDAIILDMKSESYYSLNETGKIIVSMVVNGRSKEDVVASLTQTYDIDIKKAESDFDKLLSELTEKEFLIQTQGVIK